MISLLKVFNKFVLMLSKHGKIQHGYTVDLCIVSTAIHNTLVKINNNFHEG